MGALARVLDLAQQHGQLPPQGVRGGVHVLHQALRETYAALHAGQNFAPFLNVNNRSITEFHSTPHPTIMWTYLCLDSNNDPGARGSKRFNKLNILLSATAWLERETL